MKKLLTLFTLLLCVCSGAWADATQTYDLTGYTGGSAIANGTCIELGGAYVGRKGGGITPNATYGLPTGNSNVAAVFVVDQESTITVVMDNQQSSAKSGTLSIASVSDDYYTACTEGTLGNMPGTASQTCTISVEKNKNAGENEFSFESNVAAGKYIIWVSTTINASIYFKRIEINAAAAKKSTTTVISGAGITNTDVKTSTAAGTLTATVTPEGESALASPTIKWSSDDEDVAKVGETTGVVTLVAAGTANITATYEGDGTYAGSFDIFELDVTDSRAEITPSLTYDNTTLILGQTTTATPTLTGNTGNGDVTYSSDNTDVATVDENTGVVTAVAVGTAHITASVAATSEYRAGSAQAEITVINNPFGSKSITWTLSPINSNDAELTSTSVSTSAYLKNIGEIDHSKVSLNSSPSKASNRTAKIDRTVGKDNDKYVFVTFDVEDGYYFIPSSIDVKVANVNNETTFDAELVDEHDVTVSETGKTFASTDGTVETWTIENEDNGKSMSGTVTLKIYGYAETAGSYRFGNQIQISGKVVEAVPVTISDKKYATFASDRKLDFSGVEGLCAYTATVEGDELTFTKVTGSTAAEEGLLLYSETAKTYNVPVATGDPAKVSGNKLVRGEGTAVASDGEGETKNYVLSMNGAGDVNFYLANGNTVPTSKAYLKNIPTTTSSKFFLPTGEDETDGIKSVQGSRFTVNGEAYNLAGQRVGKDYKGIVIVNGKKIVRK